MPKQPIAYDGTDDDYRTAFQRGMALDQERQKVAKALREFNRQTEASGVHNGAVALARRLRRIPDLERRRCVLREFARVLVDLEDEILRVGADHNQPPSEEAVEEDAATVPFGKQQRRVA